MRIVRALAFDKSEGANWFVPWHQDRAADGSEREIATLERMVALRVHLDDCQEDNGPLEVAPGSHRYGRLEAAGIAGLVADTAPLVCL
ncbi:phytanoyl-CoA dioxygenase family protein, partial [Acinetobacter baumannii]